MRVYFMAFLRRGAAWTSEQTPATLAIGQGHMQNIQRLVASGKLVLAGPFLQPDDAPAGSLAGIFLLDVATQKEAEDLMGADPAVKAGRFSFELLPWYGPEEISFRGRPGSSD